MWDEMIRSRTALRRAIQDAETVAARVALPGHRLTLGERRVIATLLRQLADVGRRAFDPEAREDWSVVPVEPTAASTAAWLFPSDAEGA